MMIRIAAAFVIGFLSYAYASQALRGFVNESYSVASGLSFTRTIYEVPGSFDLRFNGNNCGSTDDHGDNDCHFDWGDDVTGVYKLNIANIIDATDKFEGHFKIDSFISYSFSCALCGEDCVLEVPVVKFKYIIPMPSCPVPAHNETTQIEYQLSKHSPTEGILTHLEGHVKVVKASGETLANVAITVYVK
mmetsp:Transcript_15269/g.22510  ORF Transcript_15269/g.22510 Transcript_15269/m.22510 type:complete len:190 (-) Transcript_15269:85-654(-)